MDRTIKKQITTNILFVIFFSLIFALYCAVTEIIFDQVQLRTATREVSASVASKLIVIDAGHGGEDGGAVGVSGVYEKDLNLDISRAIGDYLKFTGYEIVQTRTEDILLYDRGVDFKGKKKMLDLAARLEITEKLMPDLFISIHMNSFPDPRYSGLTVYYSPNNERSYIVAEEIRSGVIDKLQPDNKRELKRAGSNIYLLDLLTCPALLVECGFISNEAECARLSSEEYRHKLSLVLFSSISSFFEE